MTEQLTFPGWLRFTVTTTKQEIAVYAPDVTGITTLPQNRATAIMMAGQVVPVAEEFDKTIELINAAKEAARKHNHVLLGGTDGI